VTAVHFLQNGNIVGSAGDETLRIWDTTSGREISCHRWGKRGSNPFPAVFRYDGHAVAIPASGLPDATVILDTNTGAELGMFPGSYYLAWSPDGRTLATAEDGRCHLWDIQTGLDRSPSGRHFERPDRVIFSADGRRVLTAGGRYRDAFVWDAATGRLVAPVPPIITTNHRSLMLSPDGTRVVGHHCRLEHPRDGGPKAPHFYVWDIESGQVQEFPLEAEPQVLTWSADGQALILSDSTGLTLHSLHDSRSHMAFRRTRMIARSVRSLPNGQIVGLDAEQLCVWDMEGQLAARLSFSDASTWLDFILAVSHDSSDLAVFRGGTIGVYRPQPVDNRGQVRRGRSPSAGQSAGQPFTIPEGFGAASFNGLGSTAEFLPDGRLLVGACRGNPEDGGPFVVKVWEAATRLEVWESPTFSCGISEVVFAPGGRSLAVALDDATTVIFDVPVRPTSIHSGWVSSTVIALARGIRDENALDRLPILADALQDAGCDDIDILILCRDPNATTLRASWVLDLILGTK
jgi:WD40 repeat protein